MRKLLYLLAAAMILIEATALAEPVEAKRPLDLKEILFVKDSDDSFKSLDQLVSDEPRETVFGATLVAKTAAKLMPDRIAGYKVDPANRRLIMAMRTVDDVDGLVICRTHCSVNSQFKVEAALVGNDTDKEVMQKLLFEWTRFNHRDKGGLSLLTKLDKANIRSDSKTTFNFDINLHFNKTENVVLR